MKAEVNTVKIIFMVSMKQVKGIKILLKSCKVNLISLVKI